MKKSLFLLFIIMLVFPEVTLSQVNIGGYILTDERMFTNKDNKISWNEVRLDLKIEASPTEGSHIYSEVWLRRFGFPEVAASSDLMQREKNKVDPCEMVFREAYIDLYGFLTPNLDVRIGKQRIAWGRADKLNPTDNLNPDDLEDVWDFGRHLGSNAINFNYYLGDYTLTAVYIPVFTPAVLPIKEWAQALSPTLQLPSGLTLGSLSDNIITPENNFKEGSMAAFKIDKNFLGYDFSLSYFHGRDDLPIVRSVKFTPVDKSGTVDISSELVYPKMKVLGMDMAGAIRKVGIWAEGAVFFPEKIQMTTDLTSLEMGFQRSIALDDKPFFKYVIGGDYTFKNGFYVNGQYLHGFIHERGENNLGDYFIFGVEKKLLNDKIKIIPAGGGIEIKDFGNIKNNYAVIFNPEIEYSPVDNAYISLGIRIIEGKNTTNFGKVKDNDEVYFKVKYSF